MKGFLMFVQAADAALSVILWPMIIASTPTIKMPRNAPATPRLECSMAELIGFQSIMSIKANIPNKNSESDRFGIMLGTSFPDDMALWTSM